jgi:hypothetical protein
VIALRRHAFAAAFDAAARHAAFAAARLYAAAPRHDSASAAAIFAIQRRYARCLCRDFFFHASAAAPRAAHARRRRWPPTRTRLSRFFTLFRFADDFLRQPTRRAAAASILPRRHAAPFAMLSAILFHFAIFRCAMPR